MMNFNFYYKRNKPFIVEFAGPPKSGKTTIIERIKYELPYHLSILKEVSLDSPVPKNKVLKYMEWSANELINKLIFTEEIVGKQLILVDCGIVSQIALLRAFKESGRVKEKEEAHYNLIMTHLLANLKREDLIIFIDMNTAKEIKRIKSYKFPQGFIINEDFLKVLNDSYKKILSEVKKEVPLIRINGELDPKKNSLKARREIIKAYNKSLK